MHLRKKEEVCAGGFPVSEADSSGSSILPGLSRQPATPHLVISRKPPANNPPSTTINQTTSSNPAETEDPLKQKDLVS
ncbi:hypothetical protein PGT21_031488 [Puccinia graminis f. sp. tritici]|uniref:Uncharacterized protein n=1 Tax=Puccinia graminis f. sp. tritici TaxID=56615 RepID=A0A5B0MWR0_PUCGR|nr:hypothetical protein PGT21_031488 [Puccinia graminis f. sp. tritici]KAA1131380.1 hypothetical protein PGTUg99_033177 [Puccinia graminis f. sp. tritici]